MDHFAYLYAGLNGKTTLVPWIWLSVVLMGTGMIMLLVPRWRSNERMLAAICVMVFFGIWIDKGLGLISGGFIPSPLQHVTEYVSTVPELFISLGVYGIGLFCLTILLKIVISIKEEAGLRHGAPIKMSAQ